MPPAPSSSLLPTLELVTPRRWDLAVKWRFFQALQWGHDPDAERVYRWMIAKRSGHRMQAGIATDQWKLTLTDYVNTASALLSSMRAGGFSAERPIPIDPDGELLDGSHRVACALTLGIAQVPVERRPQRAWAPPWGEAWFLANRIWDKDLERVRRDYLALTQLDSPMALSR